MDEQLDRLRAALSSRYRIEREIGHGGMATVYLARDLRHDRNVAIKVLRPELAAAVGPDRFLREIEIAARLNHPHILALHDSGDADGVLYYVMPFVEGESLRDRLQREQRLPIPDALRITREVADALGYAHGAGIVHRDIKPENILLHAGHAVVTDFGIARAIATAQEPTLTATGMLVGTASYMSPEQAAGDREIDGRSDIYALGAVLFEMLAGRAPYVGPTVESLIAQRLMDAPPSLADQRDGVPARVDSAVGRALMRDPAARFQTAGAFVAALDDASAGGRPRAPAKRWLVGGLVTVALGAAVLGLTVLRPLLRDGGSVVRPASRIAVIPPVPTSPDTALVRLGRDLVVTLSAALDGVGDIRMVHAQSVLAGIGEPGAAQALPDAARFAAALGASSFLHGGIVPVGTHVRLELGLYTSDSLRRVTRATATGPANDLVALTDSLAWSLLRGVWTVRAPPTPSLAAVTTRSLPALGAFLDGERAFAAGQWDTAADAYARAFAADTTFWLASMLYSYVTLAWSGPRPQVDSAVARAYVAHLAELPEAQRSWIAVAAPYFGLDHPPDRDNTYPAYFARYADLATRFADYWPIWFDYADDLTHWGPYFGHPVADARAAWQRTLTLNPRLRTAWDHLALIQTGRDSAAAAAALTLVEPVGGVASERMLYARARLGGVLAPAVADSIARRFAGVVDPEQHEILVHLVSQAGAPQAQVAISARILERGPSAEAAVWHRLGLALGWATRGRWDSTLVAVDQLVRHAPSDTVTLLAYRLAVVGAWLGVVDPGEAAARRPRAGAIPAAGQPTQRWELAWLDGLLAAARRDARALTAARQRIAGATDSTDRFLEASLQALELELSGERRRAAAALTRLEWEVDHAGYRGWWIETHRRHPFVHAVNRLAAGRWHLMEGDTTTAAKLLAWHEAWLPSAERAANMANAVIAPLAYYERARVAEAHGRLDLARELYAQFRRRYDQPMDALRPLVEEADRAMARLRGDT